MPRRPIVLLMLTDGEPPDVAVERASWLADGIGGELHTVVVLAKDTAIAPGGSSARVFGRIGALAPADRNDIMIRSGNLGDVAIEIGAARHAALVVVSPDAGGDGDTAIAIGDALRIPVLVARELRPDGPVIAATDMSHLEYPVLKVSWELARRLHKSITFFHSAMPASLLTLNPIGGPVSYLGSSALSGLSDEVVAAKLSRLHELAAGADDVEAVVARSRAPLDGILKIAHDRGADIVTVGHRRHSWLGRRFEGRLSEKLADRCSHSVLIVPVEGR
jgi:nucleotide-binding universal stress UspA family protein